jgi:hypothetical protein
MYGISRIDDDQHRTHAWRVSFSRRGKRYVKNFPDKKWGGKQRALTAAKEYRDKFLKQNPPLTRKEFCSIIRCNNTTGISGVYRFAKRFKLKNGQIRESWYWEATWPIGDSKQSHITFPVNELGERMAKRMAIDARRRALEELEGDYWASARGGVQRPEIVGT